MSNIQKVRTNKIQAWIDECGIENTWVNILATHIKHSAPHLHYILDDPTFVNTQIYDEDFLNLLTISETGALYEYSLAYVDRNSRKDNGQFFTPDDIAHLIAAKTLTFPEGVWLDPCSGVGNLSWHLVNVQPDSEQFLLNNLILSDRDPLALLIARTLLTITYQKHVTDLYHQLQPKFVTADYLTPTNNPALPAYDYVIMNPPYVSGVKNENYITNKTGDLYAYFIERASECEGFISITPQSFTQARKFAPLRKLLLQKYSNLTIYTFDNVPNNVFTGIKFGTTNSNTANSVRAAITVARKNITAPHQITSLMRWRAAQRPQFLNQVDTFLSAAPFTEQMFPKVENKYLNLYNKATQKSRLGTLLSRTPTEHVLYVPTSPRYYITAARRPLQRSSIRTLYFHNQEDLNLAYLLLNSSLTYWWWRVVDGGMTLSSETLNTLPLHYDRNITDETINTLTKELLSSEQENTVYKLNAGKKQENIKHPTELVNRLNHALLPQHADLLLSSHNNSILD